VLFRRIATKTRKDPASGDAKEVFSSLPNEQRVAIREKLVACLTSESVTDVRKKIGDALAEVARQYTDNGMRNWTLAVNMTIIKKWFLTIQILIHR
jgi:CHAD domain-containing protein